MSKKKKSKIGHGPDDINPEYGCTNRELKELQDALDMADFCEDAEPDPIIETIGRKVLDYKREGEH